MKDERFETAQSETQSEIMNEPMNETGTKAEIVSSESEALILVDSSDQVVGYLDKSAAHDGGGVLHRAFSLFVFNRQGRLLLQRRASEKRLWPGFWSNSCCSHPRKGESMDEAVHRRLEQELGLEADLAFAYKFEYSAPFEELGTEHELCWVYIGYSDAEPVVNTTEVMDWRWIDPEELTRAIDQDPAGFTPWLKMEWKRLNEEFAERLPDSTKTG